MKNKMIDLNNHLFSQMERLCKDNLSSEELANEIERSKAISLVARNIIDNGKLALDASKAIAERSIPKLPRLLEDSAK
jgi:hypothetical protein